MVDYSKIRESFQKQGGVLKTKELKKIGLSSRQIKRLLQKEVLVKVKYSYYVLSGEMVPEEVIIARLFADAVLFLETALLHYGYTDRIPRNWQIAVDKNSEKSQYSIDYPPIEPYYQTSK